MTEFILIFSYDDSDWRIIMNDKCPNCEVTMEYESSNDSGMIYKCLKCNRTYLVLQDSVKEIFAPTKECPNCKGKMSLVKDTSHDYYQNPKTEYYSCSKCGNAYSTSGRQLNDSKFNDQRASDANNVERGYMMALLSGILIVGYVIYGVFFASLNSMILGILCFMLVISLVFALVFSNRNYIG